MDNRTLYGGSSADRMWAIVGADQHAVLASGAYTAWTEISGGEQLVNLATYAGSEVSSVTQETFGRFLFWGPPNYEGSIWLQDDSGNRWRVDPVGMPDRIGGVTGVSVNGEPPQTGAVSLAIPGPPGGVDDIPGLDAELAGRVATAAGTPGDGIVRTQGGGWLIRLVDDSVTPARTMFGVSRSDGTVVLNGVNLKLAVLWRAGDGDPTAEGTALLPSGVRFIASLGADDDVPTWLPDESLVFQEIQGAAPVPTVSFDFKWDGAGLANALAVATGTAGTGDTPVSGIIGTAPTVDTTGAVVAPAVQFAATAAASAFYRTVTAGAARRVRTYVRTPAAWAASTLAVLAVRSGTTTNCVAVLLGGSSVPGSLRMTNAAGGTVLASSTAVVQLSTWYRLEVALDQNASTARVYLFDLTGTLLYDSGPIADAYGATHDRIVFGSPDVVTATWAEAHFAATATPATPIGPSP